MFGKRWQGNFYGTDNLSVTQPSESRKHKPSILSVAWSHLFFVHHPTIDGKDIGSFMSAFWCQNPSLLRVKSLQSYSANFALIVRVNRLLLNEETALIYVS